VKSLSDFQFLYLQEYLLTTTMQGIVLILLVVSGAAVLAGLTAFYFFRKPFTPSQWLLYYVNLLVVRVLWRVELPKTLPLTPDQGALIICNHRSSIDPCIIQVVAGHRVVHWMVAQLYGQRSIIGWMMKTCEIIPVQRRGSDVSPTKVAIRLAAAGELVGMLPEGTINTTDEFMLPVRPGAVLVALKARVPILPCYIEGSPYHEVSWKPLFIRARVRLRVGKLLDLSDYFGREGEDGVLTQLTLDCVREIAKLAGRDDFQPRIAGRDWKTWQ
jgi:1-acyl-sn-glycerol-3-phosphate acyltransferase